MVRLTAGKEEQSPAFSTPDTFPGKRPLATVTHRAVQAAATQPLPCVGLFGACLMEQPVGDDQANADLHRRRCRLRDNCTVGLWDLADPVGNRQHAW